jgi:hypothetical protein
MRLTPSIGHDLAPCVIRPASAAGTPLAGIDPNLNLVQLAL